MHKRNVVSLGYARNARLRCGWKKPANRVRRCPGSCLDGVSAEGGPKAEVYGVVIRKGTSFTA